MQNENFGQALSQSKAEEKPIFIFLDKNPRLFLQQVAENDTLNTILKKEFVNFLYVSGRDKRYLKRRYETKDVSILILNKDETIFKKLYDSNASALIKSLSPLSKETLRYYSDEFKKEFSQTDSTEIFTAIETTFNESSNENTRQLTIDYLKNQNSLTTPTNYQLFKSLRPVEDRELLDQFLEEMEPIKYTREMAEKVAYDILHTNDFSVEETKKTIESFGIPFKEEVDLYLTLYESGSVKDKKDNCFKYVMESTTYDFQNLADCFTYVLRNGNVRQIKEVELKYIFTFNDVDIYRSLLYADLLGELYLSKGNMEKYTVLQERNRQLREKFLSPR